MDLTTYIRDIPDFPKKGIIFKDITPLLETPEAFTHVIDLLAERYEDRSFTKIAAIESRGFIFGAPLAVRLGCGLVLIRKKGKLPSATVGQTFDLEYGQDVIEMHEDALEKDEKVLILDDVLATGGTMEAAGKLVEKVGAQVHEMVTLMELGFLNGRERLSSYACHSLLTY